MVSWVGGRGKGIGWRPIDPISFVSTVLGFGCSRCESKIPGSFGPRGGLSIQLPADGVIAAGLVEN